MKVRLKMNFIVQIRNIGSYGFKEKAIEAKTEFEVIEYKPFICMSNKFDRLLGAGIKIKNNEFDLVVTLEEFNTLFEEVK